MYTNLAAKNKPYDFFMKIHKKLRSKFAKIDLKMMTDF